MFENEALLKKGINAIAAVVVVYNPDVDVLSNIKTYSEFVGCIWIVDNSDDGNVFTCDDCLNFIVVRQVKNEGIARALNVGIKLANEAGFRYVLTMDQDACFEHPQAVIFFEKAKEVFFSSEVAVFAPIQKESPKRLENKPHKCLLKGVDTVITSGSIVCIKYWAVIGGFDEALFIDEVDVDFCLRVRKKGFKVVSFLAAKMSHRLGVEKVFYLGPFRKTVSFHSPLRMYYMTRNWIVIAKRYWYISPLSVIQQFSFLFPEIIFTLLVSGRKKDYFFNIFSGLVDGLKGKLGIKDGE
jgi:rhamnosyltransferase